MAKILFMQRGKIRSVESQKFREEAALQTYLEDFPDLIPLDEVEDNPSRLLAIGREVSVPSGAIDLLLLDADGLVTIVETKLATNPELRRAVIGQIIEYASFVCQWDADHVERLANGYFAENAGKPANLYEALGDMTNDPIDAEVFRSNLEDNLRAGKMRLVIAVDEVLEPLRATVSFLNSFSTFDFLILQLRDFELDDKSRVFIPSLFGYAKPTARQPRHWDEDSFIEHLRANCDDQTAEYTLEVYERFKELSDEPYWGSGATFGSFNLLVVTEQARLNVAQITSRGVLYVNFGGLFSKLSDELVLPLAEALGKVRGVTLPADLAGKYPPLPKQVLSDAKRRGEVLTALADFAQKAGRSP